MNTYCVLMTSCIDPGRRGVDVHRSDPRVRLEDCKSALAFWLGLADPRVVSIVFIDNSGYPLDELVNHAALHANPARPVEFISVDDNVMPEGVHYGFSELSMIDHALAAGTLVRHASHFIKATARLRFPHVSKLLDRLPEACLFSVDSRNSTFLRRRPQVFVASQLMVFSVAFYTGRLLGIKHELGNGCSHVEDLLFRKLIRYKGDARAMLRWPVNVTPAGYAAHWEKRYDSPRQKLVDGGRSIARLLFPHWWI